MTDGPVRRLLVIKLGDLAEFVLAFGAFAAIRRHHPDAHVTLLTTQPYADLARKSGWFDEVWTDGRPRWSRVGKVWTLVRHLRRSGVDRVYDLENSRRTDRYRLLMQDVWGNKAPWSRDEGALPVDAAVPQEHFVERYARQLAAAGVRETSRPDLSWLTRGYGGRFGLSDGYVLMVAGGLGGRAGERWPTECFADLARRVGIEGRRPVVLGGREDVAINRRIAAASPDAMDLTGRTTLFDIATLAAHASVAVGSNNGPMHLIAAVGCPSVVLFPGSADPSASAPRGRYVVNIRRGNLDTLRVSEVAAAMRLR